MDLIIFFLGFYLAFSVTVFILRKLFPKPLECTSELIWHWDADPDAHTPDLEKDFDTRFDACLLRLKVALPLFELTSHKNAVMNILDQQKNRLMWILNDLEKTMKVQCIFMTILMTTDRAKNLFFMLHLAGISLEKAPIDLSHKNIFYKIDMDGNVEIIS